MQDRAMTFGEPDLRLEGLRIWVHDRQFPDRQDYWDGNWLNATVQCSATDASVSVTGAIIHLPELEGWAAGTEALLRTLEGVARLACIEPFVSVTLTAGSRGHVKMEVSVTPDHLNQRHWFQFEIDQSYLPPLVRQCRAVLAAYPIRGVRPRKGA
jgi:hypothetical protein